MSFLIRNDIKLLISDMAGTIINEKGIIYNVLETTLQKMNYPVKSSEKINWFGKDKKEVLYNHIGLFEKKTDINHIVEQAEQILIDDLEKQYFDNNQACLFENVSETFNYLRSQDIKIALNTGYPSTLQKKIINHFNLNDDIDYFISSSQVTYGRPYPYMIYKIMEELNINNIQQVAKIGDTNNDVKEGTNAGCGLVIGVLSGSNKFSDFNNVNMIINNITDLRYL